LLAHDVSHVVYGCDTGMYETSAETRGGQTITSFEIARDPTISPAIKAMALMTW